jgi:hypothetical protein
MEPEGSFLRSQERTSCPYPEPDQSSPYPIPLLEDPFQYYPPINILYATVLPSYVSRALSIFLFMLTTDNNCHHNRYGLSTLPWATCQDVIAIPCIVAA